MAAGVASVEEYGVAPCQTQMSPTDPPQGTGRSISQAGGTLRKMYFKMSKNTSQAVRNEEKSLRNSPANNKLKEEGGGGRAGAESHATTGGDHTGAGISLQPMERTTQEHISTLLPMEDLILDQVVISRRTAACGRDSTLG